MVAYPGCRLFSVIGIFFFNFFFNVVSGGWGLLYANTGGRGYTLWVTSGQTQNSPDTPITELQSQPLLPSGHWVGPGSLGGPPTQTLPQPGNNNICFTKDPVDKYTLPSPNCPPLQPGESLLYPNPPCSPKAALFNRNTPSCTAGGHVAPHGWKRIKREAKRPKFWLQPSFSSPQVPAFYAHITFPGGSVSKETTHNAGDTGSIPGWERSPGEGHGNPLQYSCLENSMGRGAWPTTVHWVKMSLSWFSD